ncbi:hypothetical protein B9Q08_04385 [Candidatus Marsarchaeota G2 archaeon ECH_B_SAG-M15]|uniref:non-specific serine/threonine protein kinase n=1 Tax=Candidatus Marsarchaeota G2 archaeon ECH_B_SAG-M15 TaxID=1978162 RepID=A0A2R6AW74_9ARCH|nr:MAG: hypothetical protein B9Q08_04385 [Candidatus Marsarchaeota G2 archaeon ECH_B_SAG-M15]
MVELNNTANRVANYPCPPTPQIIQELEELGVELIEQGATVVNGVRVLGKGTRGIVVSGVYRGLPVAVKIRRCDSPRSSMLHEAQMLRLANTVAVGPKLISASENIIVMEKVVGIPLKEHFHISDHQLAVCIEDSLKQAVRLDEIGLDHGELSRAHSHVYHTEEGAKIIDFDSASTSRKPHNYNSLFAYYFMGKGELQRRARRILPAYATKKPVGQSTK